ncbi:autophagy-related protein 9A isoform X2 [Apis cerana]|uniref:autophagy-related protein 9A isoform X2 n=1 Tax=Apis cerana TaxID=7461 RepID=UPI002B23CE06|nr:autophagy-related protein 9A isoform X2 [Apis cerana]
MKRETVITCVEPNRRAKTMTTVLDGSYQRMEPYDGEEEDGEDDDEHEETPQESGVMIHVVPEGNKARWNHVEDLDSFFTRMYHYHQKHGFACMILQEALELGQFIFVVTFSTFLFHCINYSLLFKNGKERKISISDVILSTSECVASMGLITWICILVAAIFWILRLVKVLYHCTQFWDIKLFFNTALKIEDCDLDNLTWHEIQKRVREVQKEQEMCIHKRELTELDIYHRILRFKNYMVAMINKSLLPVRLKVPIIGEIIFLTRGLKYNMELLLFWGPWSPFENNWHLKEDYKKLNKRQELARALSKHILWVGIVNFLLCPLILLWQILYSFFNYGEIIKREPGTLGTRMWSLYGRLYLRHFNELDHELNARLNHPEKLQIPISDQYTQAEDGKTELSLIHFTLTNPEWKPPSHAENFVTALRERVKKDVHGGGHEINPLLASLNSLSGLGPGYNDIISNIIRSTIVNQASGPSTSTMFTNQPCTTSVCTSGNEMLNMKSDIFPHAVQCGLSKAEGPVHNEKGLLYGLQQEISNQSLGASVFVSSHEFSTDLSIPVELIAADMSLSTLYLHELHHRQVRRRGYQELAMRSVWQRSPVQELATLPEVRQERAPLLLHQDSSIRNNREFKYNLNTHLDSI